MNVMGMFLALAMVINPRCQLHLLSMATVVMLDLVDIQ
jgi:hypothetical protein